MPSDKNRPGNPGGNQSEKAVGNIQIAPNARNSFANVAQVKATLEEVILLLGTTDNAQPGPGTVRVLLNKRIVLNPIAAKRFAAQLNNGIRYYESKFGSLDDNPEIRTGLKSTPPLTPPPFRSEKGAAKIDFLFEFLESHQIRPAFESSCQFLERQLVGNRFLLGFEKHVIQPNPDGSMLDVCAKMNMPKDFMVTMLENLPKAKIVGFGFGEEKTCIIKAYLEFGDRFYRAVKRDRYKPEPYLSHLGFKWDVDDNHRKALTKYTCFPGYTTAEMLDRLGDFYQGRTGHPLEIIKKILTLAASRVGNERFLFLDVKEENNPRLSFDINVYPANLQIADIHASLLEICRHYSIPPEQFQNLHATMQPQVFGHLAGGLDREGRDFITLYFGE